MRFAMGLALIGAAACSTLGAEIPPKPVDGKIDCVYSYEQGQQQARATGRPLFVVFRCER